LSDGPVKDILRSEIKLNNGFIGMAVLTGNAVTV
jgi:hypothetical protein